MDCDRILDLADALLDGTLRGDDASAVEEHLGRCEACRDLIAALRDAPQEAPELTAAILLRTSGPVCDRAQDRLGALVDAVLDGSEAATLRAHLGACPECAALFRVMTSMRIELPLLASGHPDPAFVSAVLARTSARPRREPLVARWLRALDSLLDRPRIALEGAFLASALLVAPLGMFHGRGAESAGALDTIRNASGATAAMLNVQAHTAWATTRGFVAEHADGIAAGVERAAGTFSPDGASSSTSNDKSQEKQ